MTRCQCKSGFFALRDCEEPVAGMCPECARMVCARHLAPGGTGLTCLDCAGRAGAYAQRDPDEEEYGDDWLYGYRDRYYRGDNSYSPIYDGSYYDRYYDDYDTRSFDRGDDGGDRDEAGEEQAAPDFGDS